MKTLTKSGDYVIAARRITGTHDEKVDQIEEAIQQLLEIKLLECAPDRPGVRFIAVPRRTHWFPMTVTILMMLALLVLLLGAHPVHAQEAGPTPPSPAPESTPAGDAIWSRVKFGASLEGYAQYDWNRPADHIIPFRAYDTRADSFSIQQAAFIVDAAPDSDKGSRAGLRIDLQFGQAVAATQGSAANEPRPDLYRNVWQAYGSYIFPVGRGLQIDFGKFASNLGYETNYAKDNQAFSRALLFNFLPYYHTGLRAALPVSDKATVLYMLTNGIQQTEDFNAFKSHQIAVVLKPAPAVTWTTNVYAGQEQPESAGTRSNGWFQVFDTYATIAPSKALALGVDVNHTTNQVHAGDPSLSLDGIGLYARYQIVRSAAVGIRYERLDDEGLFTPVAQVLRETTLTAEYAFAGGFVARAEFRRDDSNRPRFPARDGARFHQNTALVGLVWWIGNKTGAW